MPLPSIRPIHPNGIEFEGELDGEKLHNHTAASINDDNIERYENTPFDGGSMRDWPDWLKEKHGWDGKHVYDDAYGRMKWDKPSVAIKCEFTAPGSGRYGHPEQVRAISIREGAALQTFPDDYVFHGGLTMQKTMIGNAVPPMVAEAFGREILSHYRKEG